MNVLPKVVITHFGVSLAAVAFLFSTMSCGAPMGKVKFVDVDGVKTGYFEGGSGEAMVLVHGGSFGSTVPANCWSPIFDDLAAHFHVYVVDKLGQGYTDNPVNDADYTMGGGSVNKCVNRHQAAFSWVTGLTGTPLTYWAPW